MAVYVDVALPLRVDKVFQYGLPPGLPEPPPLGALVLVPFGARTAEGFCVAHRTEKTVEDLRDLLSVNRDVPPLPGALLQLAAWMARYYAAPLGTVLSAFLPVDARSGRGRVRRRVRLAVGPDEAEQARSELAASAPSRARILEILLSREDRSLPLSSLLRLAETSASPVRTLERHGLVSLSDERAEAPFAPAVPPAGEGPPPRVRLTPEQDGALGAVLRALEEGRPETFLLHGVTGSGKTEVYLRAIEEAVRRGRQALTLVPEIALTPQMVGRYAERFPRVAVWHSGLTAPQRRAAYRAIRRGEADIVVGARSAVFAPFARLGLVIVDEEHEPSFKQQNEPRYHARDVAVLRGRIESAPVVLGSATPSLESYRNACEGKYTLRTLPRRVDDLDLPPVEIVSLAGEKRRGTGGILSERLRILTDRTLSRGEQAIFFLNRRGYSTLVQCPACGFTYTCPRCEIPLTFHRSVGRVTCHYCRHSQIPQTPCPSCRSASPRKIGIGTQQVEKALRDLFPEASILRMDSDAISRPEEYREVFASFRDRTMDILIGTQMVAKGFDFPHVTLVGVILADLSLAIPDFRSAERTFQLITQVAGRAGRSRRGGTVVVQTYKGDHYSIACARTHDFEAFAEKEFAFRRLLGYPPFGHMARLLATGPDKGAVREAAARAAAQAAHHAPPSVRFLGPAPAPSEIIRGRYREHLLVLSPSVRDLTSVLAVLRPLVYRAGKVRLHLDVDPQDML